MIEIWKQRNFAWYMGGASVSLFGMWAQRIAVGWLAWELTNSTTWLGLIAFADLFPTVVVTPFAGALADRSDRRRIAIISQCLGGLQAFALALLTFTGLIEIWSLFFLTVFLGVAMAFATAARLAIVPNLLEKKYIPSALATDSAIYNAARVVGPIIAATLILNVGKEAAFLINGCTFAVFVLCLFRVRILYVETSQRAAGNILAQSIDGFRYAFRHPGIGPILVVLTALAVGVKPFLELLPALADDVFGRGVDGFAQLAAAAGAGAVITAVWLAVRGRMRGLTLITLSSTVFGSGGIVIMCLTENFLLGLFGAFISGAAVTLSGTGTQTLMQNAVEGGIRGRVMSLYGVLHRGMPALGALLMGVMADLIGLRLTLAGGAVLFALSALIWILPRRARMIPALEEGRRQ
ncbi:MFS transporter [Alphaproteobacteria bacterium]|nr:MFS transporter [Alphaproteobacteria bacterium]